MEGEKAPAKPVKVIRAQKIPKKDTDADDKRELYATFCYYYQQYTYKQAKDEVPFHRIQHMVRTAQKIEATKLHSLTQIAAAPHSEKGKAVKKLLKQFEDIMNG